MGIPHLNLTSKIAAMCAGLFLLAGCETAQVASVIDPDYVGRPRQDLTVVIEGPQAGLIVREGAEASAQGKFGGHGVKALTAMSLIPATQEIEDDDARRIYQQAGASLLFLITEFSVDSHQAETPVHYTPGISYSRVVTDKDGNQHIIRHYEPGRYSGGHRYTRSIGRYEARLIDLASGRVMWRGDVNVMGGTDYGALAGDAAEALAKRVMQDGFFLLRLPID